jgi:hypothetical protein
MIVRQTTVRRTALCAGGGHTVGRDKRPRDSEPFVSADRVTITTPAGRAGVRRTLP